MFFINICVMFVIYTINDLISPLGIFLYVPALYIIIPAVFLKTWKALLIVIFTSQIYECILPVPTFSLMIIWVGALYIVKSQRFRFRSIDWLGTVLFCEIINATIFIFSLVFFKKDILEWDNYLFSVFVNLLFSSLFLVYAFPFLISVNKSIFKMLDMELNLDRL